MPRAIWTGSISFGLVNVPVKLFSATEDHSVSFRQFDPESGERIRYQRVTERSGTEVAYQDIVKGYELDDGNYVLISPEELEAVEPGKSRAIDIEDFIDLDAVDPVYFDKTYHLAPADEAAAKPYALLREAMRDANRVAIARFVMRAKQHLAAIRVGEGDALVLETMHFADEVRDAGDIREMRVFDGDVELNDRERAAAQSLVESLTAEWEPTKYEDTYRERVLDLVARKAEGERIVTEKPEEPTASVTDLMAVLEASVQEARQKRSSDGRTDGRTDGRADGRAAGSDGRARYEDMSKDELYEEAKRRGIEGRSSMTKDQLVEALSAELAEAS